MGLNSVLSVFFKAIGFAVISTSGRNFNYQHEASVSKFCLSHEMTQCPDEF